MAFSILIKICIYIILYKDSEPLLNAAHLLCPLRHSKFRPAFPFTVKLILHPASSFALSLCQTENRIFPFLSTKIPFLLCISCQTLSVMPLFPLQYPSFFALRTQKSGLLPPLTAPALCKPIFPPPFPLRNAHHAAFSTA